MNRIEKARARMMFVHPFYASLLLNTPFKETAAIPTAAVDDKYLYYNAKFIDSLDNINHVHFVLAHEVLHIALSHVWRLRQRDRRLWNIACDYVINDMLVKSGFTPPHVNGQRIGLFDPKYHADMSADEVYAALLKERQENPQKTEERARAGWGDDMREPDDTTPQAQADGELRARELISQAANMARGIGKLPGSLERLIDGVLNPTVPWQELLRDFMSVITQDDETWSRRNRRYADIYLPTRHSEAMGEVVVIGDTSGSITAEDLARMGTEITSCAHLCAPERIRVVWADTKVSSEQVFDAGDHITLKPSGGGGTDMRVPLKHVEKYEPTVVILITDGYTPWPKTAPAYPLIVCCTTSAEVPIGQVVRVS